MDVNNQGGNVVLALVGNKIDRPSREVDQQEVIKYANSIGALHFETSAKTNHGNSHFEDVLFRAFYSYFMIFQGIDELFVQLTKAVLEKNAPTTPRSHRDQPQPLTDNPAPADSGGCC